MRSIRVLSVLLVTLLSIASCGDDSGGATGGEPVVAVTTTVLGDVVDRLVGDQAEVVTVMPRGASPHDFQASARQAAQLADADLIVVNGGGFEEGLLSVVSAAEGDGVPVVAALDVLPADGGADANDEEHAEDDERAHEGDAHFFTDPLLMAEAVEGIADALLEHVPAIEEGQLRADADALVSELEALHAEIEGILDAVPEDRRVLVTDHDVFSSFADRYGFEVVATVIPSGSTSDGVSGGALAELADTLARNGVAAVFTEQTASADLAETLAAEVGDVEVVALYAETLGPVDSEAGTYDGMMRVNAARIAAALGA